MKQPLLLVTGCGFRALCSAGLSHRHRGDLFSSGSRILRSCSFFAFLEKGVDAISWGKVIAEMGLGVLSDQCSPPVIYPEWTCKPLPREGDRESLFPGPRGHRFNSFTDYKLGDHGHVDKLNLDSLL